MPKQQFDYTVIELIDNAVRNMKMQPMILSSPPAGTFGKLPQTKVSYDSDEIGTLYTPASGASLLDNLNHIRYRLDVIESGGGPGSGGSSTFLELLDTPDSYAGFAGQLVSVTGAEDSLEFVPPFTVDSLTYRSTGGDLPNSILEDDDELPIAESTDSFLNKKVNTQDLFSYLGSTNEHTEWLFDSDEEGWTLGANWAWDTGGLVHTPGSDEPISINLSLKALGWWYRIFIEVDGDTAGSVEAQFYGTPFQMGQTTSSVSLTSNFGEARLIVNELYNTIDIYPSADFDGGIYSIYIERVEVLQEIPDTSSSAAFGRSTYYGWLRVPTEAPNDGQSYVRKNSDWEILPAGHDPVTIGTPDNGLSITGQELTISLAGVASTGALSDTDWNTFNDKLDDAPSDGTLYGRKNATWEAVPSGTIPSGTYVPAILTPYRVVITSPAGEVHTDNQFFYDEDNNHVILGAESVPATGSNNTINIVSSGTGAGTAGWTYSSGISPTTGMPFIAGWRARGLPESPESVLKDMGLLRLGGRGYDGTTWSNTQANILLVAEDDWSASQHGAGIGFYTTVTGTTTLREVAHLYGDGNLNLTQSGTYNINGVPHTHEVDQRADMFNDAEGDPGSIGTAADGTSTYAARRDHVHARGATLRELLTGNRTYYVRTDGSDSNTGLANNSGGAFLTIQKAINVVCGTLDMGGFTVTIQVGSGTYTNSISVIMPFVGGFVTLQGDTTTPSNVVISHSAYAAFQVSNPGTSITIQGFKVVNNAGSALGNGLLVSTSAQVTLGVMEWGACTRTHLEITSGGTVNLTANQTISGDAPSHWYMSLGGKLVSSGPDLALTGGTRAFSNGFLNAESLSSCLLYQLAFTGTATGTRYILATNSVVNTFGGGANYLPGNAAGTTATGAQYV